MKCQIIFLHHGRESTKHFLVSGDMFILICDRAVPSRPMDEHKSILRSEPVNENFGKIK